MKLFWLKTAEEDLDMLFRFYERNYSLTRAKKMYNSIFDRVDSLVSFPELGFVEQELSSAEEKFRALIVLQYFKLIYIIRDDSIYIVTLWDCRQDIKQLAKRI